MTRHASNKLKMDPTAPFDSIGAPAVATVDFPGAAEPAVVVGFAPGLPPDGAAPLPLPLPLAGDDEPVTVAGMAPPVVGDPAAQVEHGPRVTPEGTSAVQPGEMTGSDSGQDP